MYLPIMYRQNRRAWNIVISYNLTFILSPFSLTNPGATHTLFICVCVCICIQIIYLRPTAATVPIPTGFTRYIRQKCTSERTKKCNYYYYYCYYSPSMLWRRVDMPWHYIAQYVPATRTRPANKRLYTRHRTYTRVWSI